MNNLPVARNEIARILNLQKAAQLREGTPDSETRGERMDRAIGQLHKYRTEICKAVSADFGIRSSIVSTITEVMIPTGKFRYPRQHLAEWMKREPRPVPEEPGNFALEAWIEYQPLGVVGILSPWNSPVNLTFSPLFGALSAGNRAMVKPSEYTPRTAALIALMIDEVFDESEVAAVTGGPDIGEAFCSMPFDHLMFTGGTEVGKRIMRAAAENLVPVTLELGGKSPVLIGHSANDIDSVAQKVMTGKMMNSGQICLSPDWVLCPEGKLNAFVETAQKVVAQQYPDIRDNEHYTPIINDQHFQRIQAYLDDARGRGAQLIEINPAGEDFSSQTYRKIPPTLVLDVNDDMAIMNNEIFGPLLIIRKYGDIDDAIAQINARPRPLALYYFGSDENERDRVISRTISGGVTINDVMKHAHQNGLPFGGVGASGMGAYHGLDGFKNFSHAKAVVVQSDAPVPQGPMSPPYGDQTQAFLAKMLGGGGS